MTFTNIHVQAAPDSAISAPSAVTLPRLRKVTNDPAREYAQRPGEVEKLPNAIAALILSKQGFSKVSRNGIRIEGVTEKPLVFWHENSVTIAEKAGTNDKVLWTLNRLQPDVLHILGKDGEYIETIPLETKAEWFNQEHLHKVLGSKRRSQQRIIDRVAALHLPDSEAAVDAATANDAAMKSIVHTFPHDRSPSPAKAGPERIDPEHPIVRENLSPGQRSNLGVIRGVETVELPSRAGGRARSSALGPARNASHPPAAMQQLRAGSDAGGAFPKASRIHEIQRQIDTSRKNHEDREHARQTASRFGAAVRVAEKLQAPSSKHQPAALTPTEIEEW